MGCRSVIVAIPVCMFLTCNAAWAQTPESPFISYVRRLSTELSRLDSDNAVREWIVNNDPELSGKRSQVEAFVVSQYPAAMRDAKLQEKLVTDYEPVLTAKIDTFKKARASVHCDQSLFAPGSKVVNLELGAPAALESAVSQREALRLEIRPSDVSVVFATIEYPEKASKFMPSEAYQSERQRSNSKEAFSSLDASEWYWLKSATVRLVVYNRTPATTPDTRLREATYGIQSGFALADCTFVEALVYGSAAADATEPPRTFTPPTTLPRVLREVKPVYPPDAKRAKVQGSVWLEVTVLRDGTVGNVKVTRSLDPIFGLDQAAIEAAKLWRFLPGTRDGQPAESIVTIELTFSLR